MSIINNPIKSISVVDRLIFFISDLLVICLMAFIIKNLIWEYYNFSKFNDNPLLLGEITRELTKVDQLILYVCGPPLFISVGFAYYFCFEQSKLQSSIGKCFYHNVKVYNEAGEKPSIIQSLLRNFLKALLFWPFFLPNDYDWTALFSIVLMFAIGILFSTRLSKNKLIFDFFAKTYVAYERRGRI